MGYCGTIHLQEQAFNQLVLAGNKNEVIRTVACNTGSNSDNDNNAQMWDFIDNKGGASIFFLHGPSGYGKTLTAKSIAELI